MTMKSFILQMDTGICSEWEKKNKRKRGIRLRDTPRSLELPSRNDGFKCIHPLQKQCFSDQRFASVQGRTWLSIDDNPANNDGLIYSTSSIKPPEAFQLGIGELGDFWVVYWSDSPLRLIRSLQRGSTPVPRLLCGYRWSVGQPGHLQFIVPPHRSMAY